MEFAKSVHPQSVLRAAITAAYRRPETECLPLLIAEARQSAADNAKIKAVAAKLVNALRERRRQSGGGVEGLIQEYSLSSQEGVALMCLAEALLRIPDSETRDALIRDKISTGDWHSHVGRSQSLFVNAATWGLVVTGKLTATSSEGGLSAALTRLIARSGEPVIRKGVDIAMRMMGEQFVTGQTIDEAIARSRKMESKGFRYSYDMLGEAAMTMEDANRYFVTYEHALHAIGKSAAGRGIYEGPGLSVKLSALHPRYTRLQFDRVMGELLPKLKHLAVLARQYDIGLNIDAEEADRLDISLDLLEALCFDPELAGWNGIGFVVQAYQKRCPFVIEWIIDLARRSNHRLMVRLVKGAYWDSEIKRAQVDGLEGFPVFTRKIHTDVSYLACARRLLKAPDAVFPQFATHNAHTLAAVMQMAGGNYYGGQYEFQCLHGMGEPLYEEVVGREKFNRPARIYAPVGTHETLLAYLVRRLLENGANTSFVNRIGDESIKVDELVADPVEAAAAIEPVGAPHPKIRLPRELFLGERLNSSGLDLSNEERLASMSAALISSSGDTFVARATSSAESKPKARNILNPADQRDRVGKAHDASNADIDRAFRQAVKAQSRWGGTPASRRAEILARSADILEARMPALVGLIVREAGKSFTNAVNEVREAVDFLRYYGVQAKMTVAEKGTRPLGPIVCISPWNFPMAIFTGQVAAGLAAGNVILAKPAEETPLIAAEAVRTLHEAGIPRDVLHLLPGAGDVGAALVADKRCCGVMFTGSTEVARLIQRELSQRLTSDGQPVPLIAETGGQNALIADSSALAEQVVADVISSAFDSAGQRCSALRVLCLQEDVADRILTMLKGAMAELIVGNPDRLSTDIGPVITAEAKKTILAHIETMRKKGHRIERFPLAQSAEHGTFVPPTLIEIDQISELKREVFGPVLHVLRYRRDDLEKLVDAINGTGYGLTFGLHTRIDETIDRVVRRIGAGNIYVNRNIIGAVVGVQPFGGNGLSGTGPKAGGPLYLKRLQNGPPGARLVAEPKPSEAVTAYRSYLDKADYQTVAKRIERYSAAMVPVELPGPVGERNIYGFKPRGKVAAIANSRDGLLTQIGAILATGNLAVIPESASEYLQNLPAPVSARVEFVKDWRQTPELGAVLVEGSSTELLGVIAAAAELKGAIVSVQGVTIEGLASGRQDYVPEQLLEEVSISTNTAAAGGNASLMSIG